MSDGKESHAKSEKISDVLTDAFDLVTQLAEVDMKTRARKRCLSIPTGFHNIDLHTGGLWPGELTIATGGPGVGKTSIAINLAVNAAKLGARVLLVSLGVNAIETVIRMCAADGRIGAKKLLTGNIDQDGWSSLAEASNKLAKLDLFICDDLRMSLGELRSIALNAVEGSDRTLVVIDGIEFISLPGGDHIFDWPHAVGNAAVFLKKLARETDSPVFTTMSYGVGKYRSVSSYEGVLAILPSGAESVADSIIHIDRHLTSGNVDSIPSNTVAKITLAKHRLCEPVETQLAFAPEYMRFMDLVE